MLSKKGDLLIRVAFTKTGKLQEPLMIVAEERMCAFMTVRGEERDDA